MAFSDWVLGKPIATENDDAQRVGPIAGVGVLGLDALASASYGPEALLTMLLPLRGIRALAPRAADRRDHRPARDHRHLVSSDDRGLPERRWRLHGRQGEPRPTRRAARRGGARSRLHPERGGRRFSGRGRVGLGSSRAPAVHASSVLERRHPPHDDESPRGPRHGRCVIAPTYAFVVLLFSVIGIGLWKTITSGGAPVPVVPPVAVQASVTVAPLYLLVRAFANGCTAMTGVEAVSNGVPVFKEPARRGAQRTLTLIVGILMVLLAGVAILCISYKVTATPPGQVGYQSVLSQVIGAVVGRGPLYYVTVGSVVLVLTLSANTSFADLPRVCSILADDGYLPEPFLHRGRRLAFSHGVVALGLLAGVLLIVFDGITEGLIPLFAVGALSAFTLSQIGMIAHWRKQRTKAARRGLVLNVVGALATGATLLVVLISKFDEGAWISIVLVAWHVDALPHRAPPLPIHRARDGERREARVAREASGRRRPAPALGRGVPERAPVCARHDPRRHRSAGLDWRWSSRRSD